MKEGSGGGAPLIKLIWAAFLWIQITTHKWPVYCLGALEPKGIGSNYYSSLLYSVSSSQ